MTSQQALNYNNICCICKEFVWHCAKTSYQGVKWKLNTVNVQNSHSPLSYTLENYEPENDPPDDFASYAIDFLRSVFFDVIKTVCFTEQWNFQPKKQDPSGLRQQDVNPKKGSSLCQAVMCSIVDGTRLGWQGT